MKALFKKVLGKIKGYFLLARPKQWIKNLFVFAALVFSNNISNEKLLKQSALSFVMFCLASIFVYVLNDLVDAEKDKHHPKKRNRPIASNVVSKFEAKLMLVILLPIVLLGSFFIHRIFTVIVAAYLLNNLLYSFMLKRLVIFDVMSIAFGFLLRVIAGAVVIEVDISPWILLCTLLLSLFLGFSKRRNELVLLDQSAEQHRESLQDYSLQFIDNMLSIITSSTVMAYSLYTFSARPNKYMMFTIPFVLYGIFRYQYIIYKKGVCGSPEEIVLSDKPLMVNILLWICTSAVIIYTTANIQ